MRHTVRFAASAIAATTFLTPAAFGQQQAQLGIEEIVVTARKTAENLQAVPLSVTAFTAEALQNINPRTLSDLNNLSPSLNYQAATGRVGQGRIQMRGTSGGTAGTSKATIFMDGIFIAGNASNVNFAEIEQVEVVPGPQSALYGRSTFAGAVNYTTRDPNDEYRVRANFTAANLGDYEAALWAGGPLVADKLLGAVTLFYQAFDGPNEWLASDKKTKLFETISKNIGTKFILNASDDLRFEARATYYKDGDQPAFVGVLSPRNRVGSKGSFSKQVGVVGTANNLGVIPVYPLGKVHHIPPTPFTATGINANAVDTETEKQGWRTNFQMDLDIAEHTLSINAAHQYEKTSVGQAVNVQQPIALMTFINNPTAGLNQQFQKEQSNSLEIRVTSPQDQRFRYTGGVFYEKADPTVDQAGATFGLNVCQTICTLTELGVFTPNIVRTPLALSNDLRDEAVFGGVYFDISDEFTASFEGRYQWEYRRQANYVLGVGGAVVNIGVPGTPAPLVVPAGYLPPATREALRTAQFAPIDLRGTFKAFLPRFNLQYKINDDVQVFAIYSKGNNPGGFNTSQFIGVAGTGTTPDQRFVKEEELANYELGMKSVWMDNRLLFNASIYYMDWTNLVTAATYFTPPPQIFFGVNENRGSSHSQGIEAEMTFIPAEGWTTRATFSYTDSVYDAFCSNNYALLTGVDDDPGPTNCRKVDGNKVDLVPPIRSSISAGYTAELQDEWSWFVRGDLQYQDGMWTEEFNFAQSYPSWNSNLHIGVENDNFNVELFCRNCTDNKEPLRLVRFSDLRGPGPTNATNQSIGHQPRYPFQFGMRVVYNY